MNPTYWSPMLAVPVLLGLNLMHMAQLRDD